MEVLENNKIQEYQNKKTQLDKEPQELRDNDRKWNDQSWEIDFAKNVDIVPEGFGSTGEAVIKEVPQYDAGKVKKYRWHTSVSNTDDLMKHKNISNHRQEGLK
jgi:hypothetical protein